MCASVNESTIDNSVSPLCQVGFFRVVRAANYEEQDIPLSPLFATNQCLTDFLDLHCMKDIKLLVVFIFYGLGTHASSRKI